MKPNHPISPARSQLAQLNQHNLQTTQSLTMAHRTVLLLLLIFACMAATEQDQPKSRSRRSLGSRMIDKLLIFFESGFQTIVGVIKVVQQFNKAFDSTQEPFYDYDGGCSARSSFATVAFMSVLSVLLMNFV